MRPLLMLVICSLVIAIHEYGHFFAMRQNNIIVEEFSIGLGPELYRREMKSGTAFSLRAIPFGGYVRPADNGSCTLAEASPMVRLTVLVTGMFMNALAAFMASLIWSIRVNRRKLILGRRLGFAFSESFLVWFATPILLPYILVRKFRGFLEGVRGPIAIFFDKKAFGKRNSGFLRGFIMLNAAVAGFNLIPLWPLDGGNMAIVGLERFGEHAVFFYMINSAFFMLLLVLWVFFADIRRLFRKKDDR